MNRPEGQLICGTAGDVGQRLLDRCDVSLIVYDATRGRDGDRSETKVRIRDDRAKPFSNEVHEFGVGSRVESLEGLRNRVRRRRGKSLCGSQPGDETWDGAGSSRRPIARAV